MWPGVPGGESHLRDGSEHLRVDCAVHAGVYAPQSEFEQEKQAEDAPEEKRLSEF